MGIKLAGAHNMTVTAKVRDESEVEFANSVGNTSFMFTLLNKQFNMYVFSFENKLLIKKRAVHNIRKLNK